ncbi:MAG TPA: RidA family protein [Caulobacteraceae bacterium]|jgi:enamine deaminase RidA (YjgF/YER057c/UK114 family)|nr:RidA family protein [Caulobacteraceae bacterium]
MSSSSKPRTIVVPKAAQVMYDRFHFAPATRVGDTIWVSGQVGLDANFQPAKGMAAQAALAFEGVKAVLAEAGASLGDVVELTTFHIDLRGDMAEFSAVKDRFFPKNYPSWTAIGTTQLAVDGLLVEVRAVAVAGSALD